MNVNVEFNASFANCVSDQVKRAVSGNADTLRSKEQGVGMMREVGDG